MSMTSLLASLLMLFIAGACSDSDKGTTLELLSTVPADAEVVGVLRVNTLVDQTGGHVKDGRIEDAKALNDACDQIYSSMGILDRKYHELLFSPDSGLEASSVVFFSQKGKPYISALIADEAQLKAALDKFDGETEWVTEGKMQCKGEFVIREGRLWNVPAGDYSVVEKFANLSEVESYRSNAYAESLSAANDAVSFWGSLEGIFKTSGMSFSNQATARMAMGMFFNSPDCIVGGVNVDKDFLKGSVRILDSNLKPSKCELAVSKIDTKLVASLGGNANFIFAAAVSQKLVKQLVNLASSFGGAMPEAYSSALEPLDGTVVLAATMNPAKDFSGIGFKGAVQTSGKNNARLLQVLEPVVGKVQVDGDVFRFGNEGYGTGVAPLADVAKNFEGAWIGIAGGMNFSDRPPHYPFATTLVPADGSLRLDFKMNLK